MLGALGALIPEILQYFSSVDFTEPVWWKVGYAKLQGEDLDYFGIPGLHIAGGQGILIIAFCQAILMVRLVLALLCRCSISVPCFV